MISASTLVRSLTVPNARRPTRTTRAHRGKVSIAACWYSLINAVPARTFFQMPSENEMFYRVIQKGLDFWNAAFFCGSGAVMRRRHLEITGGLSGVPSIQRYR